MSDESSDNTTEDSVQDYLDLLLAQATESPAAQVGEIRAFNAKINSQQYSKRVAKVTQLPFLTGQAIESRQVDHQDDIPSSASKQATEIKAPDLKPYAEPLKPINLTMPKVKISTIPPQTSDKITTDDLNHKSLTADLSSKELTTKADERYKSHKATEPLAKSSSPTETPDSNPLGQEPAATAIETEALSQYKTTPWHEGRPLWAQDRFECLLFSVGGLTLAVPLVELGAIYTLDEELTPLFGQVDWFMGLLKAKQGNIRTVDTAKVVMPERYQDSMQENLNYVITINGLDWGLAVDSVSSAIILEPNQVKWRGERSKRPWLAGTVVEHMCALLDVSQLAAMFNSMDKR